jgi:hypothetical protein
MSDSKQIESILQETEASFRHEECRTCECFLGLVTQLRLDTPAEARAPLDARRVARNEIHGCLGCDPCPPGDRYAAYMRQKQAAKLITI